MSNNVNGLPPVPRSLQVNIDAPVSATGQPTLSSCSPNPPSSMLARPSLHMAAQSGDHLAVLDLLLHASVQDIDSRDGSGNTALHLAALRGHHLTISALLKAGANIARGNGRRNTPLALAAREAHVDAVSVLLDSEQDPERAARNGLLALKHAAYKNRPAVVELLLQRGVAVDDEAMQLAYDPMISELLQRASLLLHTLRPRCCRG